MKRSTIIILVVVGVLVLWAISSYNSLATKEIAVKTGWAQVENVYQRRADLIPNLVSTVKGYAAHEAGTLEKVVLARASATQVKVNVDDLSPENLQKFEAAQGQLSGALGRLMVIAESYPDLKANVNFLDLQTQLEGTENRISVERKNFNEVVQSYNTSVVRFPGNIMAKLFGYKEKGFFQAKAGADVAPEVKF